MVAPFGVILVARVEDVRTVGTANGIIVRVHLQEIAALVHAFVLFLLDCTQFVLWRVRVGDGILDIRLRGIGEELEKLLDLVLGVEMDVDDRIDLLCILDILDVARPDGQGIVGPHINGPTALEFEIVLVLEGLVVGELGLERTRTIGGFENTLECHRLSLAQRKLELVLVADDKTFELFLREVENSRNNVQQLEERPILIEHGNVALATLINVFAAFPGDLCRRLEHQPGSKDLAITFAPLEGRAGKRQPVEAGHVAEERIAESVVEVLRQCFRFSLEILGRIVEGGHIAQENYESFQHELHEAVLGNINHLFPDIVFNGMGNALPMKTFGEIMVGWKGISIRRGDELA